VELLRYFGETFPVESCKACDNCLSPRETFNGTVAAQKLLSCVYRIRQKNSFGAGLNHVIEVLTGADTEKIRKWGHEQLSTYGIGMEHSRPEWAAIGRELIRLGHLRQSSDKFSVLEITNEGLALLKSRQNVMLTKPVAAPKAESRRVGDIACDETLFDRLREVRKRLADELNVPAYIVFSDVALRQMARLYPTTQNEFARISGVGEKKLREFGAAFLAEIQFHLQASPRQIFADDSFVAPAVTAPVRSLSDSARETMRQLRAGATVAAIARARNVTVGTIYGHIVEAIDRGEEMETARFFTVAELADIAGAFNRHGFGTLTPVFEALGGKVEYDRLRLFRAMLGNRVKN
jgi:ATP-dependent DNA helicase RecQ